MHGSPAAWMSQSISRPFLEPTSQITVGDMGEYTYFYDEFKIGWRSPKDGGWYYDMFDHPLRG